MFLQHINKSFLSVTLGPKGVGGAADVVGGKTLNFEERIPKPFVFPGNTLEIKFKIKGYRK